MPKEPLYIKTVDSYSISVRKSNRIINKVSMEKQTTNDALAQSFKALVISEPIEKITIKEITDNAGVIRPTFYNHFQDKYDLLEWIIKTDIINPTIPLLHGGFIKESMTLIFANLQNEKDFYIAASKYDGQGSFSSITEKLIEEIILQFIEYKTGSNAHFRDWMPASMVAEYYARCIRFLTIKWVSSGMTIPPAEMASLCEAVFESNINEIVNEMK